MSPLPSMDLQQPTAQREFPQRMLNSLMWGHSRSDSGPVDRASSDPVKLGGCGRICEGGSWVPVFDTGNAWSPGSLATCQNGIVCDFCANRVQAESKARWSWHFEDWTAGGGQLIHLRLSFAHGRGDDLAPMLDDMQRGFGLLRRSMAWRDAGIVDWVRVLHIRWSRDRGWYPHYHVTAFVRPGHQLDEAAMVDTLQMAWRDRVASRIGRRVSRAHGLFARVLGQSWHGLYAWQWANREDEDDDEERSDARMDLDRDRLDTRGDDRMDSGEATDVASWPLYRLAEHALDGDQQAWAAWAELCRAVKGVPVVRSSKMLNTIWKQHQAELPEVEPVELGDPIVHVHASLWEKARRRGVTQMGLELGRLHGVDAMAQWWATQLGVSVRVEDGVCPRLSARDGPRPLDLSLN